MRSVVRSCVRSSPVLAAAVLLTASGALGQAPAAGPRLAAAKYSANGELAWPADADRWVFLGTSLGGDYAEGPFDPANPGTIGVVQIEPSAYAEVLKTGKYADGTMLLLTFYPATAQSEPQLKGFVQGEARGREIHIVDRQRFPIEGRAFFVFGPDLKPAAPLPLGSECIRCHGEHGRLDSSFAQFYPVLRRFVRQ